MTGVQTCALRSEEHTSELQSHDNLVCRLLLETKITSPTYASSYWLAPLSAPLHPTRSRPRRTCLGSRTSPPGTRRWPWPFCRLFFCKCTGPPVDQPFFPPRPSSH